MGCVVLRLWMTVRQRADIVAHGTAARPRSKRAEYSSSLAIEPTERYKGEPHRDPMCGSGNRRAITGPEES
jgi:hypothetical protein